MPQSRPYLNYLFFNGLEVFERVSDVSVATPLGWRMVTSFSIVENLFQASSRPLVGGLRRGIR